MAWIKDHLQKISNLREMKKKIQKHHLGDYFSSLYIILVAESATPTPESEDTFLVKTFRLVKNHQFIILFAFH